MNLSSLSLPVYSIWELLYNTIQDKENEIWVPILPNLSILFHKDTFYEIVHNKPYYPQPTPNCRYYIKPNNGSGGKGIFITERKTQLDGYTCCPEIICPYIWRDNKKYKYDFRIWVGISAELKYFICPTFIQRISNIPFSENKNSSLGAITNTALYSDQYNYINHELYCKIEHIVNDILQLCKPIQGENKIMLTGWDFIENQNHEIYVLEVNCNPSLNILHQDVLHEFIEWLSIQ